MRRRNRSSTRLGQLIARHRWALAVALPICALGSTDFIYRRSQTIVAAEVATASSAKSTIEYRRIFVPAEKTEAWPRDGEKYIPVEARDFDAWIKTSNDASAQTAARAAIKSAEYSAQLDTNGHVQGEGRWSIELHGDRAAFLPLGDTSLILRDAHWQDSRQQPPRIGIWGQTGQAPSRFGLEVTHSGVLAFKWNIHTKPLDDQVEIPWRVPAAASTRLSLDLPAEMQPHIDGGVVLESNPMTSLPAAQSKQQRRWVISTSPNSKILRISSTDRKAADQELEVAMQDVTTYQVGPRGLEIAAAWQLDTTVNQKRELNLALPAGLQLLSVKENGRELTRHITRDPSSPGSSAIIELPIAANSKPRWLTLNAWQPVTLNSPWRLPHVYPQGVFWTSGKLELSVAPQYELQRLETSDCIETGATRMDAPADAPETHSLTAYASSAAVEIILAARQADAIVRAGSSLALADPDLKGRLITQWSLSRGSSYRLSGKLAPGWIVESVETTPADAMGEWFVDRRGTEQQIEIDLSRAATPARKVGVAITGRLQRFSLNEPISTATLRMVDWTQARVGRHLLTFQSSEPYAAETVGNLAVVPRDSIDENDRALLVQSDDESKVFDLTRSAQNSGLQLTFQRGKYSGRIDVDLTNANEELRQKHHLSVLPSSSPIDHVLIYSTEPVGDGVRWTLASSDASLKAERIPSDDRRRANLPKAGELWLLRLPEPASQPIELVASIRTKWSSRALVPLLSFPEATEQHGRILVRCGSQSTPALEPIGIQPIPLPAETTGSTELSSMPICSAYRYQPADCLGDARAPRLWVSPAIESAMSLLVPRHLQLESFFWPDGHGIHRATYELENHRAASLKTCLPNEVRLLSATLDGRPLDLPISSTNAPPGIIRLSSQAQPSNVSVCFETHDSPLLAGRELRPPLVFNELTFLVGDWTVRLPEEFSATGNELSSEGAKFNWRRRLFGPLGRPAESEPFNPLWLDDSSTSINGGTNDLDRRTIAGAKPPAITAAKDGAARPSDNASTTPASNEVEAFGWKEFHETFIAAGPSPITVTHPPAITAWAVVALLSCILSGRWLRRRRAELFAIAVAIAASLALLLPAAYSDVSAGALLGLILSSIAIWPRRSITEIDSARQRHAQAAIAGALSVLLAIGLSKLGRAESATNEARDHGAFSSNIHRVLIPTDSKGRQSGSKYFVSERFLRILMAAGAQPAKTVGQWLLTDAKYSGELRESSGQPDWAPANWTMIFSIETLARDTTVVLPLNRNDAQWNETAMIDGVPQPLQWRDDGRKCAIEIAEPGRYSLAISCAPAATLMDGRNKFELAIPSFRGAKVDVRLPGKTSALTASDAVLTPSTGESKVFSAELGGTDRLHMEWPRRQLPENGKQDLSVAELRWLHVEPTRVGLDIKYILEGGSRFPDFITIAYDERWKLLKGDKPVTSESSDKDRRGSHVVRVRIPNQDTDRREVLLHFQLSNPITFGSFRLPPVELASVPAPQRWLATTTDPSLVCEFTQPAASVSTPNEFFTKWGSPPENDLPQLVFSNLSVGRSGIIAIRPRETEPVIDEELNVAASLKTLQVLYDSNISPGNFGTYRIELSVPANLSIDEITASHAKRKIPLRWSQPNKNQLDVFFAEKLTKQYRLVLRGHTPIDATGKTSLPRVSASATDAATELVRLYRDDNVRIAAEGFSAATDSKAGPIEPLPADWTARPVAVCFLDKTSAAAVRLSVKAHRVQARGDTITTLSRENGAWFADYHCQITVEDGDLDVLRIHVPKNWIGPFDVQSAALLSTDATSINDEGGVLAIRFATTVAKSGRVDLRIRSPLAPSNAAPVSVPEIVPETFTPDHRFVVVPAAVDSQPLDWTEVGVRPANPPAQLSGAATGHAPVQSFEISKDPFQVAIQPQAARQPLPQIRLADTSIEAGEFDGQLSVTRLVLASQGLIECTLQLPAGQKLLTVKLNNRPALIRPLETTKWQLTLGAPQLPQLIEIVSRSDSKSTNRKQIELRRPSLLANGQPIPVEVSLWSFAHPSHSARRLTDSAAEVSAVDQAALRFDRMVSIAEAAKPAAAELPPPDGYNWFQHWAQLLTAVRAEAQQTAASPRFEQSDLQVSHSSEEQIAGAAQRLDKWLDDCRNSLARSDSEKPPHSRAVNVVTAPVQTSVLSAGEWSYYVAEGGNDHLDLLLRPDSLTTKQIRINGLLLIAGLLIATIYLMRWPAVADFFCRWPHAFGVLFAIVYWAWLWPSWLGLVIGAATIWLALRFDWPGRSLRTEASTVLRSSRTT